MLKMRYIGEEETYNVSYMKETEHIERLVGDFPAKDGGYELSRIDRDDDWWDHSDFNTVYCEENGSVLFANNGTRFIKPPVTVHFIANNASLSISEPQQVSNYSEVVVPTVICDENYKFISWDKEIPSEGEVVESVTFSAITEYVEPLSSIIERKIRELNTDQQNQINHGVTVTLSDGTSERFTLTTNDQLSLNSLYLAATSGKEKLSWHDADHMNSSKYYSSDDIIRICEAKDDFISYHVAYFRDLRIYVSSLDSADDVNSVYYGIDIPDEFRSEVVNDYYNNTTIATYHL